MNDKLRDALEKAVGHFDAGQFAAGDAVLREALAASKQEPQVQAEPEVVAWVENTKPHGWPSFCSKSYAADYKVDTSKMTPLITLQSHRESMIDYGKLWAAQNGRFRHAMDVKDAALDACVEALEYYQSKDTTLDAKLSVGNAAIAQAKGARK